MILPLGLFSRQIEVYRIVDVYDVVKLQDNLSDFCFKILFNDGFERSVIGIRIKQPDIVVG